MFGGNLTEGQAGNRAAFEVQKEDSEGHEARRDTAIRRANRSNLAAQGVAGQVQDLIFSAKMANETGGSQSKPMVPKGNDGCTSVSVCQTGE